ncbi:Protein LSM12 homolog, related [Neospora caninum Liverpool]|uniref:Protein LSM12 homolog, related n=1 Tax=Neospora caninum (strain Liverpool) TaxID=572307 RepID=F0VIB9_NEOCL|nr:Protein LSM12 homolog, related [Neospora caninum Liverpool]CBZ53480.1 Protein LSM12 homolog, related [Neospora caninum Liverpool]CEL67468.1 TPA: Protein LSM12 homolog, related [Neospora caninum Liverpool]|eukprot:XP_003883512.1 Protein LSM12 homolog, related [Neospora caninum Liverpool]
MALQASAPPAPMPSSTSTLPPSFDFSADLGYPVSVRTTTGETFRGELYCYEKGPSGLITLKEDTEPGKANFHVIRQGAVVDLVSERQNGDARQNLSKPPAIDRGVVDHSEKAAIAEFEKRKYTIGVGVTAEAQDLFDFIWKTHPDCVWRGQDIVIQSLEVTIRPPYEPSSVSGRDARAKERITNVAMKFRQKREREAARQPQHGALLPGGASAPNLANGACDSTLVPREAVEPADGGPSATDSVSSRVG